MRVLKRSILLLALLFICCDSIIIEYKYVCSEFDQDKCITIIRYVDLEQDWKNDYFYIFFGKLEKSKKRPKGNYIRMNYDTNPLWIK
jgi:hypothetical protein